MIDLIGKRITTISGTEYLLIDIVGQGAQGIVYNESSGNFLIKLFFTSNEIQASNQVKKIQWLLQQSYPNRFIMPLEMVEKPYIGYVMKKVKGHLSLNKLLIPSKEMKFSEWYNNYSGGLRRRLYLGYQIAHSFYILHKENKAYCDISGNNILVAEDITKASVCMIDIDNLYIPGASKSGILGTARYMAPEILNNQMQPDILTDDYSLAVILFELIRVGHPYVGDEIVNGTPEMENDAYKGSYPYVDDENNGFNSSTQILPSEVVFTNKLKDLFKKTFIAGKFNRLNRATALDFARSCLEASNVLIKCKPCGVWYYPTRKEKNQCICPWCEIGNDIPMYMSFRDSYKIKKDDNNKQHKAIFSYILRESDNHITNNYINREVDNLEIQSYFRVAFATDRKKFYLLNPNNNEIWYIKKGTTKPIEIGTYEKQELGRGDQIYFSKHSVLNDPDENIKGLKILRYAVVM
jgi:DNA-binding helix-hairpin-helix protein with protein kinase domain